MAAHLFDAHSRGGRRPIDYTDDDPRLPEPVREYNAQAGVQSLAVGPLVLGGRNLGWIGTVDQPARRTARWQWRGRGARSDGASGHAGAASEPARRASRREERRKAILEERNRLARDIHDNLAQGFAAILMQLQAAQRDAGPLPPAVASSLETADRLARSHMIEARRSVLAHCGPTSAMERDVATALKRMADLGRRTTDVPIEVIVDELPRFGDGVEQEMIGIAQEALTNAVRHSRARGASRSAASTVQIDRLAAVGGR